MTWGNDKNNRGEPATLCDQGEREAALPNQSHLRVTVDTPDTALSAATSEAQTSGRQGGGTDFTKQENNNIPARGQRYPEVLQYIV